jgi:N6-adenosine-specific RNA methylase IME4
MAVMNLIETPNTVHGRLLEAVHISGYTFERACAELEWLLDENRWRAVADGYDDINAFLSTIDLSDFRIAIEQRKPLARRLAELKATQRATARLLGVDEGTIRNDLGKRRNAEHSANGGNDVDSGSDSEALEASIAEHSAAWFQANADPAGEAKRQIRNETREANRQQRHADKVAAIARGELPTGEFDVVVADPPWDYDNSGFDQAAAAHYPTMPLEAIKALPIADPTFPRFADPCVLFLWVTAPLVPAGIEILDAWGFHYKSCMTWIKDRAPGMGWWLNTRHELIVIGARGSVTPITKVDSVFVAPVDDHSRKPSEAYRRIERMFPGLRRVECFARSPRDGWSSWGDEVCR